jgi:predicted DNA-binding protein
MARVQFASTVDETLRNKLKELSDKTRIPQAKYLDEALEDLMKKYEHVFKEDK